MSSFAMQEGTCQLIFSERGVWFHACTSENHPVFLISENDYKLAVTLLAMVALSYRGVKVIAFEFMNNHIHLILVGSEADVREMLDEYVSLLYRNSEYMSVNQSLANLNFALHPIQDLKYARNAIAYVHRNRFLVDQTTTPFTYQWGSNQLYFNDRFVKWVKESEKPTTEKWRRVMSHRHAYDTIDALRQHEGYASPLCFCDYSLGERLFRDARNYYDTVTRSVELMSEIAKSIGESISLTDDEMYRVVLQTLKKDYNSGNVSELSVANKLTLARKLHFDYNATNKQLCRMLKVDPSIVESLFGKVL